jgi:hypothetical protein
LSYQKEEGNINSEGILDSDSSISQKIKNGLVFSRRVVRDKPVYEYSIFFDGDPTLETNLKAIYYAKTQLDNIIIGLQVEDKIKEAKKESLNE